ncbi:MAG: outer rane efflux protein [Fibrobacteres bacterium]|nr:outer rane efflux protein [Fibrobacterota bacterium]
MNPVKFTLVIGLMAASGALPDDLQDLSERGGAPFKPMREKPEQLQSEIRDRLRDSLTLDDAVRIAAWNNRDIQTVLAEMTASRAERRIGRMPPNPTLEAGIRFGEGERRADYALTVDLSDLLFYPLKWSAAGAIFRRDKMKAAMELRGLIAEVKTSYYRLQAQDRIHGLLVSMLENAQTVDALSERQRKAGNISSLDRAVQEESKQNATLALAGIEIELLSERMNFARLLGIGASETPIVLREDSLEPPPGDPAPDELIRLSVETNPEMSAAREDIFAAKRASTLANWNRLPSLRAGVALEQEGSKSFIGPKVDLQVPLDFGWNAAAKAKAEKQAAGFRLASIQDRTVGDIKAAAARLSAARKAIRYYRDEIIPLREKVVEETQKQYNFMLLGVYQLIQAKQNEYAARRGLIESQRDYWLTHTELERISGGPIPHSATHSGGAQ